VIELELWFMNYLVYACNEIEKILIGTLEPSPGECQHLFTIACNALKRLADDQDFSKALDQLEKAREVTKDDFVKITELDHFVGNFLTIERDVLLKAGLSSQSVHYLLKEVAALRERIRDSSPDRSEVMAAIMDARDDVCSIATLLHQNQRAIETAEKRRSAIRRSAFTLGGATIIFANASAFAISLGLSTAGSAVSGAAGTALITYGLTPGEK
jgi:hypothetical protein